MELKDNVKNTSKEDIVLPWGRFKYKLAAGESKFVPKSVLDALVKRHPDSVQVIAIEEEAPAEAQESAPAEEIEEVVEEEKAAPKKSKSKGGK